MPSVKEAAALELPAFSDMTAQSGLDFSHHNGGSGRFYYVETYGSGGTFKDWEKETGDGQTEH